MLYHKVKSLSSRRLKLGPLGKVLYQFILERLISAFREFTLIIKQTEQATRLQQTSCTINQMKADIRKLNGKGCQASQIDR